MTYLMDKQALAKHCCISTDTVDARVRAGLLPPGKAWGGKMMWKRSDVEAHLDVTFGGAASEADIAAKVRRETRQRINAR